MPLDQATRQIAIDTPLGANVLALRNFTATEELGRLFQIDAELVSENFEIAFKDIVGQNVTIRLNTIQDEPRYFNGHIRAFRHTGIVEHLAQYRAVIVPKLWFLTRSADCRIFQNKTVPDIVKEILRDCGIAEIEDKLTGNYGPWDYCVQYRETHFNFVSRLMEEEGFHYYFKHANGSHTIVLADSDSTHPTFPGYSDMPFQPTGRAVVDFQGIREWTMAQELQPGSYTLNDYYFEKPKTSLLAPARIERDNVEANHEMYDYPGGYTESDDGTQYARIRIEELQTGFETAHGSGEVRGVSAGFKFNLTDAVRSDDNDSYLVLSAMIHAGSEGYLSDGSAAGDPAFACSFTAIRANTPFRPARLTPKPIIQGTQTAIVVGPKGDEIYTDKYGRVKVQFHWDRYGKSDENSSCWIRTSQPGWAGKGWGAISIPRIGQEVIVEFEEGDPDLPIVTGRVYNADTTVPYDLPSNKTQTGFKSRSSTGGGSDNFNEIRFEDKKGEEMFSIQAEKDREMLVKNDNVENIGHDEVITVNHDQTETVGNNRVVKIVANHTENIGASMNITVASSLTEMVAVNYAETVGAAMELTVGAALAVTVGAAMAETVGGAKVESVGMLKSENIGGNRSLNVGGDKNEKIAKNRIVTVAKDQETTIGGQQKTSVTKESILNAKKVQIVAEDEMQLKAGSANITLKKNGDILINGKKVEIKGSGDVVIKGSQIKEN